MKYSVDSLLRGIEAHRKVQLGIKTRQLKKLEMELRHAEEVYWTRIARLQPELAHVSDQLLKVKYTAEQASDELRALGRWIDNANRSHELKQATREYERAKYTANSLYQGTKTEFELWLLSLKDEDVTEISSHSIKSAGFDERSVTTYVTAVRKLESQEAADDHRTPA